MTPTFAASLDWNQLLTTGGFAVATLVAAGLFFNRKVWPFLEEYMKAQRSIAQGYQTALMTHITDSQTFITTQLDHAQRERSEELRLFMEHANRTQMQLQEGRQQFLAELQARDVINAQTVQALQQILVELKLDGRVAAMR